MLRGEHCAIYLTDLIPFAVSEANQNIIRKETQKDTQNGNPQIYDGEFPGSRFLFLNEQWRTGSKQVPLPCPKCNVFQSG